MILGYRNWRLDYWMQRAIIGIEIEIEIECIKGPRLALALTLDMADTNSTDSDTRAQNTSYLLMNIVQYSIHYMPYFSTHFNVPIHLTIYVHRRIFFRLPCQRYFRRRTSKWIKLAAHR